ncbi:AAWKG family protein [Streptomyces sp. NPDC049967]|uniref:AAWKG family protein n=1 Tax=unclassified Streptomyces TaxID=2593676 RepID=UPI003437473E
MALDSSKITNKLTSANDKWAEAAHFFTGYKAPARSDLFDTLVGNEGIPMMKVEISDVGYVDYVDTEDMNWLTDNAGYKIENTDFVIPFYHSTGGEGSDVTMYKARISMLGNTGGGKSPSQGYYEGGQFSSHIDGHLGMDGKPTWDTTPLTQYAFGTGLALEELRNNEEHGTYGFSWGGKPVDDADSVTLGNFDVVAGSFDRVAQFFASQQKLVEEWQSRVGKEKDDAWRGKAAGVFWDLVHKVNKQYSDYAEDMTSGTGYSKQGNEIRAAKKDFADAVADLHNAWMKWEWRYGNPLILLNTLLTAVMDHVWHNNITKITYEIEPAGESYYTNYIAEANFDNEAAIEKISSYDGEMVVQPQKFGELKELGTWLNIGNKAVEMWQQTVIDQLDKAAIDAMEKVRNSWSNSKFDLGEVKSRGTSGTLESDYKDDKADVAEEKAAKDAADAKAAADDAAAKQAAFIQWQKDQAAKAEAQRLKDKAEQEAKEAKAKAEQEAKEKAAKEEQERKEKEAEAKEAAAKAEQEAKEKAAKAEQDAKEKEAEQKQAEQEAKQEAKEAEQEAKQEAKEKEAEQKQAEQEAKQEAKQAEQEAKQDQIRKEQENKQAEAQARSENMQILQMKQAKEEQEKAKKEQDAKEAQAKAEQEAKEKEAEQKQAEQEAKQEAKEAEQEAKQEAKEKEAEQKQAEQEKKQDRIRTEQEDRQEQQQEEQEKKQAEQEAKQEAKEKEAEQKQAEAQAKQEAKQEEQEAKQDQIRKEQENKEEQYRSEQEQRQKEAETKQDEVRQEQEKKQAEAEAKYDSTRREALNGGDLPDLTSTHISGPVNDGALDIPGGGESHIDSNGRVITEFPDGSTTTIDPVTHSSTVTGPDGSTSSGPLNTGDLLTNPGGSTTHLDSGGNVVTDYPDGSTQTINPDTGTTTVTHPDGSTTSGYVDDAGSSFGSGHLNNGSLDYTAPSYDAHSYEEELFDENPYESPLAGNGADAGAASTPGHNRPFLNSGAFPGPAADGSGVAGASTGAGTGGSPTGGGGGGGMGGGMGGGKGGGQSDTGERVRNVIDGEVVNNRRPRPGAGLPPRSGRYADDEVRVAAGGPTAGRTPFMPPVAGGGGGASCPPTQTESGERARDSWVPEDDDVWGTDEGGAPAVIGR